MFGHDICFNGRLDTFLIFSAFKIDNSVSLWVNITRKPNNIGRPSLCFARKQSSNAATGCDVINRWIIGTRNFAKSWAPPWSQPRELTKRWKTGRVLHQSMLGPRVEGPGIPRRICHFRPFSCQILYQGTKTDVKYPFPWDTFCLI